MDELEDQESLPFVDPYSISKIPRVENAQPSTQICGTPESSWQVIGPPKIKYPTGFRDDTTGFPGFSRPVTQLDENIQDIPSSPLGRIDLGNIMKDVDTNMNILNSTEEPDWVPQGFLEDDEDDLFEKDNNQVQEGNNKYYVIIVLKCLLILFMKHNGVVKIVVKVEKKSKLLHNPLALRNHLPRYLTSVKKIPAVKKR